jgi:CubicO group peptidase (beta-lactamase class C family)
MIRTTAFALALTLAPFGSLRPQTAPDRYHDKLQPILENMIREQEVPGFAIAVVENNRVAYAAAFGTQNVSRKDDPVTTRSLFHMASITKTFVATSIMQLVEAGKIDLAAPVTRYLPYFRMADERYRAITVRQMVTHTSGMPDVDDYEWDKPQYDEGALERYVRSLAPFKLEFAPGEKFQYSNMAFEILGDVIAKVSGEPFDNYVQRHILTPLGMKDSTLMVKQADQKLLAWGHELDETGAPFPSKVYPYNRMHSPSSNLHSNVLDMSRYAIANLNRGELDGARILKTSTYDVMWTPSGEFGGKPAPTGISWFLDDYKGNRIVSHGGGDTGFRSGLAMLPEKKIAVVWATNSEWLPNTGAINRAALDTALGLNPQPITGKRNVAQAMLQTYERSGIGAAIQQYQNLKKLRPTLYNFAVGPLNSLGRYLTRNDHASDAVRVLQMTAAAYPSSAETFDLLGGAHEKAGDQVQAIAAYERAVELDPKQEHAAESLKRLRE